MKILFILMPFFALSAKEAIFYFHISNNETLHLLGMYCITNVLNIRKLENFPLDSL